MNWAKPLLVVAALYNIVIGAGSLFGPGAPVETRVVGLLVLCFGIVYAVVSRDVERFRPVLWAGVLGKLGVVALMGPEVASGVQPPAVGWILAGDALFMLAFLAILLGKGRSASA